MPSCVLPCADRWCPWRGSNTRPLPYQGSALPLSYKGQTRKGQTVRRIRTVAFTATLLPSSGAGEGNRTLVISLEGFCSTIELHPPGTSAQRCATTTRMRSANPPSRNSWWRRLDSNQRRRKPTDLQSAPFSHSGTPPKGTAKYGGRFRFCQRAAARGSGLRPVPGASRTRRVRFRASRHAGEGARNADESDRRRPGGLA